MSKNRKAQLAELPERTAIRVAFALHDAGYHVLTYDWRRHGESEDGPGPLTYGPVEALDFAAAVQYLRDRPEVGDIGVVGTSAGGNVALYGAPEVQPIKAMFIIQPTKLRQ